MLKLDLLYVVGTNILIETLFLLVSIIFLMTVITLNIIIDQTLLMPFLY